MDLDFISGQFTRPSSPEGELVITSPADLAQTVARIPWHPGQVDRAISAAREASRSWAKLGVEARANFLKRYQAALQERRKEIERAISLEIGKPLWESATEVGAMITKVDVTLKEAVQHSRDWHLDDLPGEVRHRPHGVVAVIGPFNFPGHLPNGQIVPALLAGNTVVFKPSEKGATTAALMARCFSAAGLPPGVFNLVQGAVPIAERLVSHADIDAILFTGSLSVGQRIVAANAHRPGVLVALELGGKNASLVLDDCDLERTVREVAFSGYATAGQRCTATSRVIVMRDIADAFAQRLCAAARSIKVGHPEQEGVFMGPVINEDTRKRCLEAQQQAVRAGFEALVPGTEATVAGHSGYYLRPGLHRAPSAKARIDAYTERELFAPDLCLFVVDSVEEAIAVANDTPFGLSAAVFTKSKSRFEACVDELRVGVLHWNRSSAGASGRLPFGGIKGSGNHRPGGVLMGTSCVYPLGLLYPPATEPPLPTWPGVSFEGAAL